MAVSESWMITFVPLNPPYRERYPQGVQCLSKVDLNDGMQCGRCDHPATCALHDADQLATSSSIFFLCGEHLRQRLDRHPSLLKHFLQKIGPRNLYAFYDVI
jgi:hypothetical protein